jgi:hypothetical protein
MEIGILLLFDGFIVVQIKSILHLLPQHQQYYTNKTVGVLHQSHGVRTSLMGRLKLPVSTAEGVEKSDRNRKQGLHHPRGKVKNDKSNGPCKARSGMSG